MILRTHGRNVSCISLWSNTRNSRALYCSYSADFSINFLYFSNDPSIFTVVLLHMITKFSGLLRDDTTDTFLRIMSAYFLSGLSTLQPHRVYFLVSLLTSKTNTCNALHYHFLGKSIVTATLSSYALSGIRMALRVGVAWRSLNN